MANTKSVVFLEDSFLFACFVLFLFYSTLGFFPIPTVSCTYATVSNFVSLWNFCVFLGICVCFVELLLCFFLCLFVLFYSGLFLFYYFIIILFVSLLFLDACLFSSKRKQQRGEDVGLSRWRKGKSLWGVRGGEAVIKIYCLKNLSSENRRTTPTCLIFITRALGSSAFIMMVVVIIIINYESLLFTHLLSDLPTLAHSLFLNSLMKEILFLFLFFLPSRPIIPVLWGEARTTKSSRPSSAT